jgi:four helix bundle protein
MDESFASLENLAKLKVYILARNLAKIVWSIVIKWKYQEQKTIGDQWIRAADSVSANIAEGYGRYFFNDSIKFYFYSRGSCFECFDWLEKAKERNLINSEQYKQIIDLIDQIPKELNILVKRIRTNSKSFNKSIKK